MEETGLEVSGSAPPVAAGPFAAGTLVTLRGLVAKPELNGCTGTVVGPATGAGSASGSGRRPVKLDNGQVRSSKTRRLRGGGARGV
jgi:hypothetical protein